MTNGTVTHAQCVQGDNQSRLGHASLSSITLNLLKRELTQGRTPRFGAGMRGVKPSLALLARTALRLLLLLSPFLFCTPSISFATCEYSVYRSTGYYYNSCNLTTGASNTICASNIATYDSWCPTANVWCGMYFAASAATNPDTVTSCYLAILLFLLEMALPLHPKRTQALPMAITPAMAPAP